MSKKQAVSVDSLVDVVSSRFHHLERYRFGSPALRQYFRTDFVERDAGVEYLGIRNGYLYAALCLLPVTTAVVVLATQVNVAAAHVWLLPVYFLVCNFLEYLIHRGPMHHKLSPHNQLYAHTTVHHNFYNDAHFFFEQPRDLMASLLPWYAFLGLSAIIAAVSAVVYAVAGRDDAVFFAFVACSYYLLYEVLHAAYHSPPTSLVKRLPFVTKLAQLHIDHHQAKEMVHHNFNITFPIFDVVFGTLLKAPRKNH